MLHFRDFELETIPMIEACLDLGNYDSCDYSIGGIYMWADYFGYRYCIESETLFMESYRNGRRMFFMPCGAMRTNDAVLLLRKFCFEKSYSLQLSVVPEELLPKLPAGYVAENTPDWNDYLYDIVPLTTYDGHALKNKRNRARKFEMDYKPLFETIDGSNIAEAISFLNSYVSSDKFGQPFRTYENRQTLSVMDRLELYPFHSLVVRVEGRIQGVIVGETRHNVLFVHIEKSEKSLLGINESLFRTFVAERFSENPALRYVNREEDMGDEGLRRSKLSFNPIRILKKYTVTYE